MLIKRLAYIELFIFAFLWGAIALASDDGLSATPNYSYDSYKSRDTYILNADMNSSLSKRNYSSSARSFSGNVLINRNRSQNGYGAGQSGYTPSPSGYSSQPVSSSPSAPQRGSAYYKTSNYKY